MLHSYPDGLIWRLNEYIFYSFIEIINKNIDQYQTSDKLLQNFQFDSRRFIITLAVKFPI